MPSINRIRVNNIKYNFGTQMYDDFSMRMYGRNTLYDLANGGGKSVLMLLLMQCVIPNSTLDDKQPIEKLFRDPSNTVIHSMIEWKLDDCDVKDGLRYMTTGFAAKKASGAEANVTESDTAEIEYFNYVIFYRNYNKNDIVNIPLVKENERVSYKQLKNYLSDLSRNDKNLVVQIFDRKGEYQRFIADYGLYESQWQIIRGINKTEGHVRTYFETNYRTTRKVVEDLLIDEIIEKAYETKTRRTKSQTDSAVSQLLTIEEELRELSMKKKDIALFDHEKELMTLLKERIESFGECYGEKDILDQKFASIVKTLRASDNSWEEKLEELKKKLSDAEAEVAKGTLMVDLMSMERDKVEAKSRHELIESKTQSMEKAKAERELKEASLNEKKAFNEILDLLEVESKLRTIRSEQKMRETKSSEGESIRDVVLAIKKFYDKKEEERRAHIQKLETELSALQAKIEEDKKLRESASTEIAAIHSREEADMASAKAREALKESMLEKLSSREIGRTADQLSACEHKLEEVKQRLRYLEQTKKEEKSRLSEDDAAIEEKKAESLALSEKISVMKSNIDEMEKTRDVIHTMESIYDGKAEDGSLEQAIREKLRKDSAKEDTLAKDINLLENRMAEITEGRMISDSKPVVTVIDYIRTRHNENAMSGMSYLSALSEKDQKDILAINPELPYGVVTNGYDKIKNDPGLLGIDSEGAVLLYDIKRLREQALDQVGSVTFVRREEKFFLDQDVREKLLHTVTEQRNSAAEELKVVRDNILAELEDLESVITRHAIFKRANATLLEETKKALHEKKAEWQDAKKLRAKRSEMIESLEAEIRDNYEKQNVLQGDMVIFQNVLMMEKEEKEKSTDGNRIVELRDLLSRAEESLSEEVRRQEEVNGLLQAEKERSKEASMIWKREYAEFAGGEEEIAATYDDLSFEDLEALFHALRSKNQDSDMVREREKLLVETLESDIRRHEKNLKVYGADVATLREKAATGLVFRVEESGLDAMADEVKALHNREEELRREISAVETEEARILGNVEFAEVSLSKSYGEEEIAFAKGEVEKLPEINGEHIRLAEEKAKTAKAARNEAKSALEHFSNEARGYDDILKYSERIVKKDNVSLDGVEELAVEDIRAYFDDLIMDYDKVEKAVERASSDTLKIKMKVVDTLNAIGAMQLATTVREDVDVPDTKAKADELIQNIGNMLEIIDLEKSRVETSIVNMEELKDNFVEQCIERCLDVRTEIEKLPHLSMISIGNEKINMIRLSIPYVADNIMKPRMEEYISKVLTEMDEKPSENEKQKFLAASLAMKKLFSVIVTDMSRIRLMLYKRERIAEQSRYLRYEEAVGSTGQSQGIYIQFLISIINYISGMYSLDPSEKRSKTIFIDNPFGAAKDIYIWEPIFELLRENQVQLVVPTRGATPEITGRFDVNYILGQQMTGKTMTTVVVDYNSKTNDNEMEYKELDYEQASFDFL